MPSSSIRSGDRFPRCWYTQYDTRPPTMCSSHHGSWRISSTHASEMFQSSIMSWSSKIIDDGTTDKSQRSTAGVHASRYNIVYSSKSATRSVGGSSSSSSRSSSMTSSVSGEGSSAYT